MSTALVLEIGISAVAGTLLLRRCCTRAVLETTRLDASSKINAFSEQNIHVRPLQGKHRTAAEELLSVIQSAQLTRKTVLARMNALRIPDPLYPTPLGALQESVAKVHISFLEILKSVYELKIDKLFLDEFSKRFGSARGWATHKAAHQRDFPDDAIIKIMDELGVIDITVGTADAAYEKINKLMRRFRSAPHDVVKQTAPSYASTMSGAGHEQVGHAVADHATAGIDAATNATSETFRQVDIDPAIGVNSATVATHEHLGLPLSDHAGAGIDAAHDATAQHIFESVGHFQDILFTPGILRGTQNIWSEYKMFRSGEADADEFILNGMFAILRSGLTFVGSLFDGCLGTAGLATAAASYVGKMIHNCVLAETVDEQQRLINEHVRIIQAREQEMIRNINRAAANFLSAFKAAIEECPQINNEPRLIKFIDTMQDAYQRGLSEAIQKVTENLRKCLQHLPEPNWLETILFINPSQEVEKSYAKAARKIESNLVGLTHQFAIAAQTNPETAVEFMLRWPLFHNSQTFSALDEVRTVIAETSASYSLSLTRWEDQCVKTWNRENANYQATAETERSGYEAVVARETAIIKSIRRQRNANLRRMGAKVSTAAT